jgi:hypothetical protein
VVRFAAVTSTVVWFDSLVTLQSAVRILQPEADSHFDQKDCSQEFLSASWLLLAQLSERLPASLTAQG